MTNPKIIEVMKKAGLLGLTDARTCAYRNCTNLLSKNKLKYCSDRCMKLEYQAVKQERPIFSLEEIKQFPRIETKTGYINIKVSLGHIVGEHVLVAENMLGRRLIKGETVHHKNGARNDNRPENLEVWGSSHPAGQRLNERLCCPNCGWPLFSEAK